MGGVNITGEQALALFTAAMNLVRDGKYDEARRLYPQMLPSDATLIEKKIMAERERHDD